MNAGVSWLTDWVAAAEMPAERGAEGPGAAELAQTAPAAHGVVWARDQVVARCSVWSDGAVQRDGKPVGVIGHFAAAPDAREAAVELLHDATRQLRAAGLATAVGPMDGNTWRKYRFISERGAEPLFFLESDNPAEWPEWWQAAGFAPCASYYSALTDDLAWVDPRAARAEARLQAEGIALRCLEPARFEAELRAIHALSLESFAGNFLYTPIGAEEFVARYRPIASRVRPEFVWLAERAGELVGFVFCLPDFTQAARGERITTLVVKTLAVRPGRAYAGLGAVLMPRVRAAARAAGFTRLVHAYMHEANASLRLSAHYARTFRRYVLLASPLTP